MMLLPPSANPALELSPLIWLVQPPEKSPELSQFGSQCGKNKNTEDDAKKYSISVNLNQNSELFHFILQGVNAFLGGFHAQSC